MISSKIPPEVRCMEPENYRKYFRMLCWNVGKSVRKKKSNKKDKLRRLKSSPVALCFAPSLLGNPSHFAVHATVRRTILERWRHLYAAQADGSDDSDNEDSVNHPPVSKLPKITGIGLKMVFSLISEARNTNSHFCEQALRALLDVLQGHAPEELSQEPTEIISHLHGMLMEITNSEDRGEPSIHTALSSSCLVALCVARGEAELILSAVTWLIMSPPQLANQNILIPTNLTKLQRGVQSVILGPPSRNQWVSVGVPQQCLVSSFPVELPTQLTTGSELVVRSLASDGTFLYVFTSKGLLKIGSGYGSSIRQHVYLYKPDFFPTERHGWLGFCKNKLYVRIGRKKTELYEVDKDSLSVRGVVRLDPGTPAPVEPKSAVFSDGNQLGLIVLTNHDNLTIRMYEIDNSEQSTSTGLVSRKELVVPLLRRRTLALGRGVWEEGAGGAGRRVDCDQPTAAQLYDCEDDPLSSVTAGQDFAILTTLSGKVYYTGKGASLGYKTASPQTGRWILMKESIFNRNDAPNGKKCKVIQVAMGHEGVHAVLVLDSGTALFAGVARRGEDGDVARSRRTPKATRPRPIHRAEGHSIVFAACNYGTTALVTRQGLLLMFGKDTQHCDQNGLVTGLRHERVVQVALGKAHAVALTNFGHVYTFGINNKGQCGRDYGATKEKYLSSRNPKEELKLCTEHTWVTDYCRVCILCKQCTGYSSECHCSQLANRLPGEKCGCGEGDSGCSICGVCRRCAETQESTGKTATIDDGIAGNSGTSDNSVKATSLPPGRVATPGGHRVVSVSCGLHHTAMLSDHGEVLTFGWNQYGQLGTGDTSVHHRIIRLRIPRATSVVCGSNHTALLSRDDELYTFGAYQKGALGRRAPEDCGHAERIDRGANWFAAPGRVARIGARHGCKPVWITAAGDQTFVQLTHALINTDTLFSSTLTANHNCIVILPNRPEHTFKCITINKTDATCNAWTGPEQVDFVNTLATLDPLYDVLWCYQPQMRVIKCYNVLAYDWHRMQKSSNHDTENSDVDSDYPNYGNMRRLEDFINLDNYEVIGNEVGEEMDERLDAVALSNISVLNQELAIPAAAGCSVTRMHAALHLLGCLDSLTYAHDNKLQQVECKRDCLSSPVFGAREEFQTVVRFESHGGGWGYSGHSVEAIRFMCDTDILVGGFGLFGGRGDYTAKIKLFDIGPEGGEHETDGEVVAESEEVAYECAPRDRYPVLFERPISVMANRWYVACAYINGPSSDCGSSGQSMVIVDEIGFHFKTSKKSNNGTDVNAGQIPCIFYYIVTPDQNVPLRAQDTGEAVITLTKNISRKVTVQCFKSLITLLKWGWESFQETLLDSNGQIPINYQKLTIMKHQKRQVYVIKSCLRLMKSYINEVYPQTRGKRNLQEYMSYLEGIISARGVVQNMLRSEVPTCAALPKKSSKHRSRVCYVQFALEMHNSVMKEAYETFKSCFHAFFPTPTLKWNQLCSLLFHAKDGVVSLTQIRELTALCNALCTSRSLRDVLEYIVPLTQTYLDLTDTKRSDGIKVVKEVPTKSATVPRSTQKAPPVPPRAHQKTSDTHEGEANYTDWHLIDIINRLVEVVLTSLRVDTSAVRSRDHEHGQAAMYQAAAAACCSLLARTVAELAHTARHIREQIDTGVGQQLITPSRFMRVNESRAWNTGSGSPDAIAFTVDRPASLVGACVYAGPGAYEYSLELLQDVVLRNSKGEVEGGEAVNPAHCWASVELSHGKFSSLDCQNDLVQLEFLTPVPLKTDVRYAVRLCNHGGRTANGDCGLPSVRGPDGTTFRFASCSLSFNGTTLARGQIPSLIYYSNSKSNSGLEGGQRMVSGLRRITLAASRAIVERCAYALAALRDLSPDELTRSANLLHTSPAVTTLLPFTMAHLEDLEDSQSVVKILEMVHMTLPHVAALNLAIPPASDDVSTTTTAHHYTWVESEHPYKPATVTNMRVLFPPSVSCIVLEMDPRSITAQPEDTLTIYAVAGKPKRRCRCADALTPHGLDTPYRKVYKRTIQLTDTADAEPMSASTEPHSHYNCAYVSVTEQMANIFKAAPMLSAAACTAHPLD